MGNSMADRPLTQPERHFARLTAYRFALEALADRYPSRNESYQVLAEAAHALDRAAIHFTGDPLWFRPVELWNGKRPHNGSIPPISAIREAR